MSLSALFSFIGLTCLLKSFAELKKYAIMLWTDLQGGDVNDLRLGVTWIGLIAL